MKLCTRHTVFLKDSKYNFLVGKNAQNQADTYEIISLQGNLASEDMSSNMYFGKLWT